MSKQADWAKTATEISRAFSGKASELLTDCVAAQMPFDKGTVYDSAAIILTTKDAAGKKLTTASVQGCKCPACCTAAIRALARAFGADAVDIETVGVDRDGMAGRVH